MAAWRQKQMLEVGDRAPDIELRDLEGHTRTLPEMLSAGPVLLAFFKTTCPVCQLTFPFLERIHASLPVYGVSQDDAESTREFNQEYGLTFPTLLDTAKSGYPVSNAYGISHVPSAFLVEPGGAVSLTMEGFDKKALQALGAKAGLDTFRPGEKVPDFKAG